MQHIAPEKQNYISDWVEFNTEQRVIDQFLTELTENNYQIFWDIGAYRGLYTILAEQYVTHTFSFEPAPVPRRNLIQNCAELNVTNYTDLSILLYNKSEYTELTVDTTSGSRTFIKGTSPLPERTTSNTVTRQTQTPADLIINSDIPVPDVVKIDIEGAEAQVLNGFQEFISEVEAIFVEIHLSEDRSDTVTPFLKSKGFTVTDLSDRIKNDDDYQRFILAKKE
jgi:FkbM family methyltransferase